MNYVLNKIAQTGTGCHKIHTIRCKRRPKEENTINLKECMCPMEAKHRAKQYFSNVNGCKYCCREIFYKIEIKI